jgi:hypothetical protein
MVQMKQHIHVLLIRFLFLGVPGTTIVTGWHLPHIPVPIHNGFGLKTHPLLPVMMG